MPEANPLPDRHHGGQLECGPDGYLYIGARDGGGSNDNGTGHNGSAGGSPTNNLGNSQDKTRYLGNIICIDPIDPDGAGPLTNGILASNPFFNDSTPGLKKIYAFGLRNPWRFSFNMRPGGTIRLFCGDVGQGRIEEINLIVAGGNYGWRYKEGLELPTFCSGSLTNPIPNPDGPFIDPIAMYAHPNVVTNPVLPQLGLSVTGGLSIVARRFPHFRGSMSSVTMDQPVVRRMVASWVWKKTSLGSDLLSWTTIVTSVAGAAPTDSGYASEAIIAGQSPLRRVTAQQNLPAGSNDKEFVRLRVDRAP